MSFLSPQAPLERPKAAPGGLLGASWTPWSSWRPLGALLEASWEPPGGLLGRKKALLMGPVRLLGKFQDRFQPKKKLLIGSWALQEEFQDRFQPS